MKNNKPDRHNPEEACGVKASGLTGGRGKGLKPGKLKYVYRAIKPPAPSTQTPIHTPTHITITPPQKSSWDKWFFSRAQLLSFNTADILHQTILICFNEPLWFLVRLASVRSECCPLHSSSSFVTTNHLVFHVVLKWQRILRM